MYSKRYKKESNNISVKSTKDFCTDLLGDVHLDELRMPMVRVSHTLY